MFAVLRDLIRYNREFTIGAVLVAIIVGFSCLSFFSPVDPDRSMYLVPPDRPPSAEYWFGTNSRGPGPLLAGHVRDPQHAGSSASSWRSFHGSSRSSSGWSRVTSGGWVDRALMSINDVVVALPIFPILVLFYFVLRDDLDARSNLPSSWPASAGRSTRG